MPIIRKLTCIGDARGVTLPKSWIAEAEEVAGKRMVALKLEVDGVITLAPVFAKEGSK